MDEALAAAEARVNEYFRRAYHSGLDEFEITNVPGYWRRTELCGGRRGGCHHEIHSFMFNESGTYHTASYFDNPRVRGRFASPTRTWKIIRDAHVY